MSNQEFFLALLLIFSMLHITNTNLDAKTPQQLDNPYLLVKD